VVVEIAVVDLCVAVQAVIIIVLAAEIESDGCKRVVEEAESDSGGVVSSDHERPMLVQWIRCLRVVAKGVERDRAQAATVLVEWAGLVAEAVETIRRSPRHGMPDGAAALAPLVRICAAIGRERRPIGHPAQTEGSQRNDQLKLRCRHRNFVIALREREIRTRKRACIEAVSTLP